MSTGKENNFLVSISLDRNKKVNDKTRTYRNGKGSFDKVLNGINLVKKHELPLGICLVLNQNTIQNLTETYDFLSNNKLNFNVILLTNSGDAINNMDDIGLLPLEYSTAWIKLYDLWLEDNNNLYASDFINKTSGILRGCSGDCIGSLNCSMGTISTDHHSYVYPCATMSPDPDWVYGNINDNNILNLMKSKNAKKALTRKVDKQCTTYKWQKVCNGECMSRVDKFFGHTSTRDYYCSGLYEIYEHIEKRIKEFDSVDLSYLPKENLNTKKSKHKDNRIIAFKNYERINSKETTTVNKFNINKSINIVNI